MEDQIKRLAKKLNEDILKSMEGVFLEPPQALKLSDWKRMTVDILQKSAIQKFGVDPNLISVTVGHKEGEEGCLVISPVNCHTALIMQHCNPRDAVITNTEDEEIYESDFWRCVQVKCSGEIFFQYKPISINFSGKIDINEL